jgi:hypothetical protein
MVRLYLLLGPVFGVLLGCGYGLGVRGGLMAQVRKVHVPPFESLAREVGVGALFARALREELAARTGVRLASAVEAEAVVEGRVKSYGWGGMAFPTLSPSGVLRSGEFRATATVEVLVRRRSDGKVLLSTGDLTVSGEFLPGPDTMGMEANRERALRQLAVDLGRRVAHLWAAAF